MAGEYSNVAQLFSELATRLRSFPVPSTSNSSNQTNNNSVAQTTPNVLNLSTNCVTNETAVVTTNLELMYVECRRRKDLSVIPPGPDGLSMKYLASFIGQGKYMFVPFKKICPLKMKLKLLELKKSSA